MGAILGTVVKLRGESQMALEAEFASTFWPRYPRKIAVGAARKAYVKARQQATLETILTGLDRFVKACAGKEPRFVPHASTFLNQERWADEDAPQSTETSSGASRSALAPEGLSHANWERAVRWFRQRGAWHAPGGPPGSAAYKGPRDLLRSDELTKS